MTKDPEVTVVRKWANMNTARLQQCFLRAAFRLDQISEVQTDVHRADSDWLNQKVGAVLTSSQSVLQKYIQEEFQHEFQDQPMELRDSLVRNAPIMVDEMRKSFTDVLVDLLTRDDVRLKRRDEA